DGPMRGKAAFAPTVHAECGTAFAKFKHENTKLTDLEAMQSDFSHADVYTGLEASISCLAALNNAQKTGIGQHIDISLAATMIAVNERAHAELSGDNDNSGEPFALSAPISPYLRLNSGEIVVIAASPILSFVFFRYARMMRRLDLIDNPKYKTAKLRRQNYKDLMKEVNDWVSTFRNAEDLEAQVGEAGLAIGKLRSMKEFAEGPWGNYWQIIRKVKIDKNNIIKIPGLPWKFSRTKCEPQNHLAFRGMDNEKILFDLGYTKKDIKKLYFKNILSKGNI
ncbi:MAG: CoA transferase, partial [Rickettsiales bacterium]|nr:CoA transferase [Rickettsiales bacterium]